MHTIKNKILGLTTVHVNISIYDKDNDPIYNNCIPLDKKYVKRLRRCYKKREKYLKNGIKINKLRHILLSILNIGEGVYLGHCKKYNSGYIFLEQDSNLLVIHYDDEIIPGQYNKLLNIIQDNI